MDQYQKSYTNHLIKRSDESEERLNRWVEAVAEMNSISFVVDVVGKEGIEAKKREIEEDRKGFAGRKHTEESKQKMRDTLRRKKEEKINDKNKS
jgi:hypothetical protein